MALTGLDIYKQLPKENCKECGVPTCLAFAMKVAAGQAGLDQCPRLTDDARSQLSEASAPPQRLVQIGTDNNAIEIGQETVLFRHDEKFHHPTAVALKVSDTAEEADLKAACAAFKKLQFLRVGQTIQPDMIALVNESGSADRMQTAAETIYNELGIAMVLMGEKLDPLSAAAMGPLSGARPVVYCSAETSADELADLAQKTGAPVCIGGELQAVAQRVEALAEKNIKDVLISPGQVPASEALAFLTQTRRAALNKKFRPLGCPVLTIACGEDKQAAALDACAYVCKYAGVLVTDAWAPELLVPILTTRQNIYTDPQKPVQVEPQLYDIGEPTDQSPLLVTTNFSLSYYSVESEVEASRVPSRILAVDTEGTSVLTAWAADKFNPETITAALKKCSADEKAKHHKVVIPGHVAVIAASLAEESGWQVLVGPKEASGIGPYLKSDWKAA
ncbi:MAG: acetyl-CoA decarbonylase/synthase complex subunit gamma [Planctomycetota bacterium]|nr:acetyl-CoA decarbonylase/synthase complex subunit gamma [Planctomycetota bacterium]